MHSQHHFPGAFPEHDSCRPGLDAALRERGAKVLCTDKNRVNVEREKCMNTER